MHCFFPSNKHCKRADLNRDTKILKSCSVHFFVSQASRWYVGRSGNEWWYVGRSSNEFFVAPNCASLCISAGTMLSNNYFMNIIYVM